MDKTVSVFLPTRAGSERVKYKNTRSFAKVEGGLLRIKLQQLYRCSLINEIILSTNDSESIKVAEKFGNEKLIIVNRPDYLAQSSTDLIDLVKYVPSVCNYEHILWTHVTSPLVCEKDYELAIRVYFEQLKLQYDSLMSVKEIQNFIWSKETNSVINKEGNDYVKWPRTQNLKMIYEVNSAIFLASRKVYLKEKDRVGKRPFLLNQNSVKSTDVDWEDDFKLAEILYEKYK